MFLHCLFKDEGLKVKSFKLFLTQTLETALFWKMRHHVWKSLKDLVADTSVQQAVHSLIHQANFAWIPTSQPRNFKWAKMKFSRDLLSLWAGCDVATLKTLCKQVPDLSQGLQNLQSVGTSAVCAVLRCPGCSCEAARAPLCRGLHPPHLVLQNQWFPHLC